MEKGKEGEEIRVGNGELKQSNCFFCSDPLCVDVLRPASNLLQIKGTRVQESTQTLLCRYMRKHASVRYGRCRAQISHVLRFNE